MHFNRFFGARKGHNISLQAIEPEALRFCHSNKLFKPKFSADIKQKF